MFADDRDCQTFSDILFEHIGCEESIVLSLRTPKGQSSVAIGDYLRCRNILESVVVPQSVGAAAR